MASLCAGSERRRKETTLVVQCEGGGDGTHGVRSGDLVDRGSRRAGVGARDDAGGGVEREARGEGGRDAVGGEDRVADEANGDNRNVGEHSLRVESGGDGGGIADN